jgi:hypothetical protein
MNCNRADHEKKLTGIIWNARHFRLAFEVLESSEQYSFHWQKKIQNEQGKKLKKASDEATTDAFEHDTKSQAGHGVGARPTPPPRAC